MAKKVILVLYQEDDWLLSEPKFESKYKITYAFWGKYCQENDVDLCRAELSWFDGQRFTKYWQFDQDCWAKRDNSLIPDVVYDKAKISDDKTGDLNFGILKQKQKIDQKYKLVNNSSFSLLFSNKINQTVIFKSYLPPTQILFGDEIINNPTHKKMVIKKACGCGGRQVVITSDEQINVSKNSLIQEFVDGRENGELKDYRLIFFGCKVVLAVNRIAALGSDFTNLHQGGSAKIIDQSTIPEIINFAYKIINQNDIYSQSIFSLDFLKAKDKIYLMEINTMPGVGAIADNKEAMQDFFPKLTKFLLT